MASDRHSSTTTNGPNIECRRSFRTLMYWDGDLSPDFVKQIWDDPAALPMGQTLQDKQRCSVARVDAPAGSFVWKRHNWGSPLRKLRRSLSRTPAFKCWIDGRFLYAAGVPTPRPRAVLERRVGPFKTESYLLTDYVPGTSLYRLMRFGNLSEQMIRSIVRQVAALWQQLVELHVQHNDFKTENLIVDPHGKVWLIDLERMCRYPDGKRARRKHHRELADLLHPRNWRAKPAVGELLRQEILKTPSGQSIVRETTSKNHPLLRPIVSPTNSDQLVSVVIPCRNAAATIIPCLRSVFDMADEILVADAGSTDNTLDLVREFGGCKIVTGHQRDAATFASWAHNQASHQWILYLRPDEQLSPELSRKVQDVLATEPNQDAFKVNYQHCFRGRRLAYGSFRHEPVVRLFRKNAGRCEERDGEVRIQTDSQRVGRIPFAIERDICRNVGQHLAAATQTARHAEGNLQAKTPSSPHRRIVLGATWKFIKPMLFQFGWLDGWEGAHAQLVLAIDEYFRKALPWESASVVDGVAAHLGSVEQPPLRVYNPDNIRHTTLPYVNVVQAEFEELQSLNAA